MEDILSELADCLRNHPDFKSYPSYLEMRTGKFNCSAGFTVSSDPLYSRPAIVLDDSLAPEYNLASSSICSQFDFCSALEEPEVELQQRMCDHITDIALHEASLKLLKNEEGQLLKAETTLTQIIEDDRLNINSFSQNALTNCCSYNIWGEIEDIQTISIDPASKKYSEEDVLEHVPHPIRTNRRKKLSQKQPDRKSKTQVIEEFQILNGLFSIGGEVEKEVPYSQVMDVVGLKEDADYNDLWQQIIKELSLEPEKVLTLKKDRDILKEKSDQELVNTITRILSQAQQYQEENIKAEEQTPSEESQSDTKITEKAEELPLKFDFAQKKPQQKTNKKYKWATEDESDLSDFYSMLPRQKFAKKYPFQLDEFQKRSILHLQKKESVFVAAHTSAGKTVVAEYGIALALKHKRKVIYTSPIKALSNQKYRELSRQFDSVGIVTGDVSMNPQASCVIMTTEILRNNLYRGAQMIRDIEWVIFDEIHYINNPDRGMVWEETIIMLPQHIGLIMLSATVPNYMDFANWVGRTKHRMIYVMKTLHRPVPLEHSLYIFGKLKTIKEPNGRFLKQEYNDLKHHINALTRGAETKKDQMKELKKKKIEEKGFYNDNRKEQRLKLMTKTAIDKFIKKITKADLDNADGREDFRILEDLVYHCHKNNLLPCVVFTFSKKRINALAQKIFGFDLTNRHQKSKIRQMISQALSNLKPEDRELDQFNFLMQICMNGYAIHHGDLLPLAKEMVELLFSQGLIKVLFATETFAMGINMPTKTVIFHSIRKVTGAEGAHRFLNSSEYVQMSGRAGRRGKDQKGNVIIIVKEPNNLPEAQEMVKMMDHPGETLNSKFKVTYQIILNLYTNKDINVQEMMRQSFLEDPKFKEYITNIKKTEELKKQFEDLSFYQCPYNKLGTTMLMEEYVELGTDLREGNQFRFGKYDLRKVQFPKYGLLLGSNNQTQLCLILKVEKAELRRRIQVMVVNKISVEVQINKEEIEKVQKQLGIKKRIRLQYEKTDPPKDREMNGAVEGQQNNYMFNTHWISTREVLEIYREKLKFNSTLDDSKKLYAELANQLVYPPKQLTPINNELHEQKLYQHFTNKECHLCQFKQKHIKQQTDRKKTKQEVTVTASRINKNQLGLMGSFAGMAKLLEDFKFIKDEGLTLKGRIARQVDIYVTQVLVEGVLDPLNFAEVAALMSAFVCDYKPRPKKGQDNSYSPFSKDDTYTDELETALNRTFQIVSRVVRYEMDSEAYLNPLPQDQHLFSIINFNLVDTVYKWADGFDFVQAKMDSKAPEGTIVRAIMRLNMLLGNIKSTCRIMGSSDLESKIDRAVESIRRDIVFCQSLYLSA